MARSFFVALAFIFFSCFGGVRTAKAEESVRDLVLIVFLGEMPENIEGDDIVEPVAYALGKIPDTAFKNKYLVGDYVPGYVSGTQPGNCIFDPACLRQVRQTKQVRHFFMIKVNFAPDQAEVEILRVMDSVTDDQVYNKRVSRSAGSINSFVVEVVTQALKPVAPPILGRAAETNHKLERRALDPTPLDLTIEPLPSPELASNLIIAGWSTFGVGAVLMASSSYFGVQANSAEDELTTQCSAPVCGLTRAEAQTLIGQSDKNTKIFNGLLISGGIVAVVGVGTFIAGYFLEPDDTDGTVEITPVLGPDGLMLFSTFHF